MKKYFLNDGAAQHGPFDLAELRTKSISRTTPIWHEGLPNWIPAENIPELNSLFTAAAPPPFTGGGPSLQSRESPQVNYSTPPPAKKKSYTGLIISLAAVVLFVAIAAVVLVNNPNAVPGVKLEINTPQPTVVTSRADGSKSGIFNARTTVHATVINQGGDGNVLVTFYVYQGNKTYDRSKNVYLRSGASEDLEVTFEEVDYISGEVTYNVMAEAQ